MRDDDDDDDELSPEHMAIVLASEDRWRYDGGRDAVQPLLEEIIRTARGDWRKRALKAEAEVERLIDARSLVSDDAFRIMSERVTVRLDVEKQRQLDQAKDERRIAERDLIEAKTTIANLRAKLSDIREAVTDDDA